MNGRLIAQDRLTGTQRDAMHALLATHFDGATRAQFDRDLSEKNWAVLIEHGDGSLVGFSTLDVYETTVDGEALSVVYSGDTIVSPAAWGSAAFPRAWIHSVYQLRERYPTGRLIWLLLTSGFRTYRLLPVFWQTFFPRFDAKFSCEWKRIRDELATRRFGERFDPRTGVVRLDHPQPLRGELSEISAARLSDPHVAFFLAQNPGHSVGDELVCIAELEPGNLSRAGRRVVYGSKR